MGVKADFLDHRLRTNLALFHVDYKHFQSPQGTSDPASGTSPSPHSRRFIGATTANQLSDVVSTFVIDQGKVGQGLRTRSHRRPDPGLTMGTGVGYTDIKFPFINPIVLTANWAGSI